MLKDKTMKLYQEITLNTAENKPMQYAAVWTENQKSIVQVGMSPTVLCMKLKKNLYLGYFL